MKEFTFEDSLETQFIYSIHKTLLSFAHLDTNNQRIIINDIQNFIQKLTLIFQNQSVLSTQEKRFKIIDILVKYLDRLFKYQIYHCLSSSTELTKQIDNEAKESTLHHLRKINKISSQNQSTKTILKNNNTSNIDNNTSNIDNNNNTSDIDNNNNNNISNNTLNNDNTSNIEALKLMNNIDSLNANDIDMLNNNEEESFFMDDKSWDKWEEMCIEKCEKYLDIHLKSIEKKWIEKLIECKRNITSLDKDVDNKVELVIRSKFVDMENQIKRFIRENLTKIYQLESDNQDKTTKLIESTKSEYNLIIQNKISENMKSQYDELYKHINKSLQESLKNTNTIEDQLNERMDNKMNNYITGVNETIKESIFNIIEKNKELKNWRDEFMTQIRDSSNSQMKQLVNNEVENKIKVLSSIFQTNITEYFEKISSKISEHQSNTTPLLNQLHLQFSKDQNEIQLIHSDNLISSIKLNFKGMIGPKGPQGKSPKIKSIKFDSDSKVIFIIEGDGNGGDYEVLSDSSIPIGPPGPKGEKGEPGTIYNDLKYQDYTVFRIDTENNNQIILLKSLSIGDNSHCLQDNSLAIGGATCYKSESLSIGRRSKTCDNQSIALYGSTMGKNSFAYRSTNVDDNQVKFGDTKNDIEKFEIHSKRIILNADYIDLLGNIKIQKYEDRLQQLEQQMAKRV